MFPTNSILHPFELTCPFRQHGSYLFFLLFATWQSENRNDDDKDVESDVGDVAHRRSDRTQTDNTRTNRNILLRVRKTYFPREK